jgi:two-component system sensor histidine kinase UhpB
MDTSTKKVPTSSSRSVSLYVGVTSTVVMLATFSVVGWLTLQTAHNAQSELEAQASKKSILISRALDRAIFNMKSSAVALSESREIQIDDMRGFYDLAQSFAKNLSLQIVVRDTDREQQLVNSSFAWGSPLPSGGIAIAKEAEEEARRTSQAAHSDVFYGPAARKHFVVAFATVTSTSGKRYSISVGVETSRFKGHLDSAQFGPDNLVTVFDRRGTIVTRSQEHDQFTGRTFNRDRAYDDDGKPEATGAVLGPNLSGIPYRWNYARSSQTGWVVSVGTPIKALKAPVDEALVLLTVAAIALVVLTVVGNRLTGTYLRGKFGRLGVDRPPTGQEFQDLFDSAPYGVAVIDTSGFVVLTNARMDAKFGYAREELVGRRIETLIPDRLRTAFSKRDGRTDFAREMCGLRKDGSEFPIDITLKQIDAGRASFVMATIVDISARKHQQELAATVQSQREEFQRRLIGAEEAERLRLAHELHDETGQSLLAVGLAVRDLQTCVTEKGLGRLRRVEDQLAALGKSLHDVARQLRPTSLDYLGLEDALLNHAADWSEKCGISIDLHHQGNLDGVPPELAIVIYRVVQEALTNVVKHATGASTVSIVATRVDDQLRLTIEDNGTGFNEFEATLSPDPASGGIGLPGMRERLALVGGELQIESSLGVGTTLHVRIPLQPHTELA